MTRTLIYLTVGLTLIGLSFALGYYKGSRASLVWITLTRNRAKLTELTRLQDALAHGAKAPRAL